MKDILVSIPSRSRPDLLRNLIVELYSTCHDRANFDIHVIIDSDQIEMYQNCLAQFPDVKVDITDRVSCRQLMIFQYRRFLALGHYFLWNITDACNIPQHWDADIAARKKEFKDDLFCVCTNSNLWGRRLDAKLDCYQPEESVISQVNNNPDSMSQNNLHDKITFTICELFPIFSKEWTKYLLKFYENTNCQSSCDLVSASMLQKLCSKHREKRNVLGPRSGMQTTNNGETHKSCARHGLFAGDIERIVDEMYEHIKSHRSPIAVVVPTFFRPDSLNATIESLCSQSLKPDIFVMSESTDVRTNELYHRDNRFKLIVNHSEPRSGLQCTRRLISVLPNTYDVIIGGDDLVFEKDCLLNAFQCMEANYPDHFGMVGIRQDSNRPWMVGAYALIGHKFINHFPKRYLQCPDYHRIFVDVEIRDFAANQGVFIHCHESAVWHEQTDDDTHQKSLWMEDADCQTNAKRQAAGLLWGRDFELINEPHVIEDHVLQHYRMECSR